MLLEPGSEHLVDAGALVDGLIAGVSGTDHRFEDLVSQGMEFGTAAFKRGISLYHVSKALALLDVMTQEILESVLRESDPGPSVTAADGVRLSRRLHERATRLLLGATRGYLQAHADSLNERFRHLRHDLRNPLGTIKSVLALMEDESVPFEARVNPGFRAMAGRNARQLEELIASGLSDSAASLGAIPKRDASIGAIIRSVQEELHAEAVRCQVSIVAESDGPRAFLDVAGVELLLRELLRMTLHSCEPGERIEIGFSGDRTRHITVSISRPMARHTDSPDPGVRDRLRLLAGPVGATITSGEQTIVSIPTHLPEVTTSPERERSVPRDTANLGDGDARHDVRSSRERHHRQPGTH